MGDPCTWCFKHHHHVPAGGQKARVALARAAYSAAAVQLLDDPLSAVDPRVGRILFDKCIGPHGIMAASTRILVTHQRQYLPLCNRVAVLRAGALVAVGSYHELAALQLPELVAGAADISLQESDVEEVDEAAAEQHQVQQAVQDGSHGGQPASSRGQQGGLSAGHDEQERQSEAGAVVLTLPVARDAEALPDRLIAPHSTAATTAAATAAPTAVRGGGAATAAAAMSSSSVSSSAGTAADVSSVDDAMVFAVEGSPRHPGELDRIRTLPPDINKDAAHAGVCQ